MIVSYTAEGWEIITQSAHGLLVAQIAHHSRHNIRTERWVETWLAIADHDEAQELERDNLLKLLYQTICFTECYLNN